MRARDTRIGYLLGKQAVVERDRGERLPTVVGFGATGTGLLVLGIPGVALRGVAVLLARRSD